jgi:protein-S-isoprenylcysteine O-methyltransferase Ste14
MWKKTGRTGFVFGQDDNAHDFIGKVFGILMVLICIYITGFSIRSETISAIAPHFFINENLEVLGLILIITATLVGFTAQLNMKESWRVGIDYEKAGGLVITGLFRYSRNPIFLTMLMALLGILFILPNWISLVIFTTSYLLIQIQIRLEEDFLKKCYGYEYLDYAKKVRRWI